MKALHLERQYYFNQRPQGEDILHWAGSESDPRQAALDGVGTSGYQWQVKWCRSLGVRAVPLPAVAPRHPVLRKQLTAARVLQSRERGRGLHGAKHSHWNSTSSSGIKTPCAALNYFMEFWRSWPWWYLQFSCCSYGGENFLLSSLLLLHKGFSF